MRTAGFFSSRTEAAMAVRALTKKGVSKDALSIVISDSVEGRSFLESNHTQVNEGAVTGSALGGVAGALGAAVLAMPLLGVLAAGPVAILIGGAVAGGASGGALGALIGLGIPRNEATLRSKEVEQGAVIVGMDADPEDIPVIDALLADAGAYHVIHVAE